MKLFFETSTQAMIFLLMLPLGILFAAGIDVAGFIRIAKPLWDLLLVLLLGVSLGIGIILLGDQGLRMYHLLAVLCGCLLYMLGLRRFFQWVCQKYRNLVRKKMHCLAGKPRQRANNMEYIKGKDDRRCDGQ